MKKVIYIQSIRDKETEQKNSVLEYKAASKNVKIIFCYASEYTIENPNQKYLQLSVFRSFPTNKRN